MADDLVRVPPYHQFFAPTLAVLRSSGVAIPKDVLVSRLVAEMTLPVELAALPHGGDKSRGSEVAYRVAWALTYLKKGGYVHNPTRGMWAVTERGAVTSELDDVALRRDVRARFSEEEVEEEAEASVADGAALVFEEPVLGTIRKRLEEFRSLGELASSAALEGCYRRFRERFGPDVLGGIDGEKLLLTMHGRRSRDSLVYWLEFKDDEEFPGSFGSIAGGSALKFGLYQSADTLQWFTGTPAAQRDVTVEEAIELARRQRDELLAGCKVLQVAESKGAGVDYERLHAELLSAAPHVADAAWGHKYFALLFHAVLDDYHSVEYQKYHITRLLHVPSDARYVNARVFIALARTLGVPVTHVGKILNDIHGDPYAYWRIGTTDGDGGDEWPRMRAGGFAAMGWSELGDLSNLEPTQEGKASLRDAFNAKFSVDARLAGRKTQELFNIASRMQERDVVVAMNGGTVKGVGVVSGRYFYRSGDGPFAHRRPVRWINTQEWKLPQPEGLQTSVTPLRRFIGNLLAIERQCASPSPFTHTQAPPAPAATVMEGTVARIHAALQRKGQVILFGPPGTGKTWWAQRAMCEIGARAWFSRPYDALRDEEKKSLARDAIETCSFHPAYGYEDFLEGYRPREANGQLAFERRDGIFKRICERASARKDRPFFLLIDEFNRGDVPRIFGELLTVIERDKRASPVLLPLSGTRFTVPENMHVIGTMNTADRSIALLDVALRRRFAFIELMPDPRQLGDASVGDLPLGLWLAELNRRIVKHVGRDARSLQIGHAFLMPGGRPVRDVQTFAEILREDIIPLVEEYCYADVGALEAVLGRSLVDRSGHPRDELFAEDHHGALIKALLSSFPEVTTTPQAVIAAARRSTAAEEDVVDAADLP